MSEKPKGLYRKYVVTKANGKPIDPNAEFLVLRLDGGQYVTACRDAARRFAASVERQNSVLSRDIIAWLAVLEEKGAK